MILFRKIQKEIAMICRSTKKKISKELIIANVSRKDAQYEEHWRNKRNRNVGWVNTGKLISQKYILVINEIFWINLMAGL